MTSQQATSHDASAKKTSFLNHENTFFSFAFDVGPREIEKPYAPRYFTARASPPRMLPDDPPREPEMWLGLAGVSWHDGEGIKEHPRMPIDVVVALDVSWSMASPFGEDDEEEGPATAASKLDVAIDSLKAIISQLGPEDRFGLVEFHSLQNTLVPLTLKSKIKMDEVHRKINALRAGGGTDLTGGLSAATKLFTASRKVTALDECVQIGTRSRRIIFLTDLNSSCGTRNDEETLLDLVAKNAEPLPGGIYTTVIGVGMDFNVALVEKISKTRGCRYGSITSSAEFKKTIEEEFDYDAVPVAFDIEMNIIDGPWRIDKAYGSPELANINAGIDDKVHFSSEFPTAHDENGLSKGGFILFKLVPTDG
ncbi:hypothetical protein HK104_007529, partial [Borealophlyctis nickersoniae]